MLGDWEFAGHAEQFALPRLSVYVSTGHPAHGPPCRPKYPVLHRHAVRALLPWGDSEWSGHAWQLELPSADAYVFA